MDKNEDDIPKYLSSGASTRPLGRSAAIVMVVDEESRKCLSRMNETEWKKEKSVGRREGSERERDRGREERERASEGKRGGERDTAEQERRRMKRGRNKNVSPSLLLFWVR